MSAWDITTHTRLFSLCALPVALLAGCLADESGTPATPILAAGVSTDGADLCGGDCKESECIVVYDKDADTWIGPQCLGEIARVDEGCFNDPLKPGITFRECTTKEGQIGRNFCWGDPSNTALYRRWVLEVDSTTQKKVPSCEAIGDQCAIFKREGWKYPAFCDKWEALQDGQTAPSKEQQAEDPQKNGKRLADDPPSQSQQTGSCTTVVDPNQGPYAGSCAEDARGKIGLGESCLGHRPDGTYEALSAVCQTRFECRCLSNAAVPCCVDPNFRPTKDHATCATPVCALETSAAAPFDPSSAPPTGPAVPVYLQDLSFKSVLGLQKYRPTHVWFELTTREGIPKQQSAWVQPTQHESMVRLFDADAEAQNAYDGSYHFQLNVYAVVNSEPKSEVSVLLGGCNVTIPTSQPYGPHAADCNFVQHDKILLGIGAPNGSGLSV